MFRRRTTAEVPAQTETAEETLERLEGGQTEKKGRPTPKRREAEKARKDRVKPPADRREAIKMQREKSRTERAKMQQALNKGEGPGLPMRDRGPRRKFIRNYIDSRRTLAEFLLPFFLVIFVLMMVRIPLVVTIGTFLWLLAIILAPLDLFMVSRRLKRELRERFPNDTYKGDVAYGLMRATQIRKLRLPKPQIKPGAEIPLR